MSEVSVMMNNPSEARLDLPPGFRFHPTDEEVVIHYLTPKALDSRFSCVVVADVDLNRSEPWDLPGKAKMGEKEWFFFVHKDRKYPTGTRTNRATASGYWKATGKDKDIFRAGPRRALVGMKKTLVFYLGRAPRGEKTPWVMHEYRLEGDLPPHLPRAAKEDWAVCRVFNKELLAAARPAPAAAIGRTDSFAFLDDFLDAPELPALIDSPSCFADDDHLDLVADFNKPGPAASSSSGGAAGYYQYQQQQPAVVVKAEQHQQPSTVDQNHQMLLPIRRHCKPETTPTIVLPAPEDMAAATRQPFPELDDLLDYSNMWKF